MDKGKSRDLLRKVSDSNTCIFCFGELTPHGKDMLRCRNCGFTINSDAAKMYRYVFVRLIRRASLP